MLLLYNLFIQLYFTGIRVASLRNRKAGAWITGRENLLQELEKKIGDDKKIIWIHCSSAGELEQGKPLVEALKTSYPLHKILLSFFSPSGYEAAGSYRFADYVTCLPLDTRKNADAFLRLVNPELVVFVKYEFWYHHIRAITLRHIPLILVSAAFRKDQIFFKSYGKFFRQMLFSFRHIFVQDEESMELLQANGIDHCTIGGDTRFDRVKDIAGAFSEVPLIKEFAGDEILIVAGSTWKGDEELLAAYVADNPEIKLILAPHEVDPGHISVLKNLFIRSVLHSEYTDDTSQQDAQVLIIDTIGLLSRLYRYATITYVGGGFTKDGIHNILEAAVWGKPVVFGPNYKKYREANQLIEAGGGFSIAGENELKKLANDLFLNEDHMQAVSSKAKNYVADNTGATQKIVRTIQEKRLLTN